MAVIGNAARATIRGAERGAEHSGGLITRMLNYAGRHPGQMAAGGALAAIAHGTSSVVNETTRSVFNATVGTPSDGKGNSMDADVALMGKPINFTKMAAASVLPWQIPEAIGALDYIDMDRDKFGIQLNPTISNWATQSNRLKNADFTRNLAYDNVFGSEAPKPDQPNRRKFSYNPNTAYSNYPTMKRTYRGTLNASGNIVLGSHKTR